MNIDINDRIENKKRILEMKIHKLNTELEKLHDGYYIIDYPIDYGIVEPRRKKNRSKKKG